MKGLIKLFSAAAFVGALASCSDDLSVNRLDGVRGDADFVATLWTGDEDATRVGVLNDKDKTVVWNEGDQVNVYSPKMLIFNTYELYDGEGTTTGSFKGFPTNDPALEKLSDLVAVTASELVYGVSGTQDGKMLLTAEVPAQFDQVEGENDYGQLYYPLSIPYWGAASFGDDLNASLKPLAALVKIDIAALPAGTRAIVLTTHRANAILDEFGNVKETFGGSMEPVSGTFNAVLEGDAKLTVDLKGRLTSMDTLRVNIPELQEAQDKTIFIPLIAQHYDRLSIIAVTGDSDYPWTWQGDVLKVIEDQDITTGKKYNISQAAPEIIEATSPLAISLEIAKLLLDDGGKHDINVLIENSVVVTNDDNIIYIPNNLTGRNNVHITFAEPVKDGTATNDNSFDLPLIITEGTLTAHRMDLAPYKWHADGFTDPIIDNEASRYSKTAKRQVSIDLAVDEDADIDIELPTSNVILSSDGCWDAHVYITGAETDNVSGYTDTSDWKTPANLRKAGIMLKGTLGFINISKYNVNNKGTQTHGGSAVYAFGDGVSDEIRWVNFWGELACPFRITDMLIQGITYWNLDRNEFAYIYTTGNAAIKTVNENGINPYRGNKINLNASWTGKYLSAYAYSRGYNQEVIYTAAQLQGMGDQATDYVANYNYKKNPDITTTSGLAYEMAYIVKSVWLGDDQYPWVGAEILTDKNFLFDGKECNFRNMKLTVKDLRFTPMCFCDRRVINFKKDIGLIRYIITSDDTPADYRANPSTYGTGAVVLHNIRLFDSVLKTEVNVPNIGSLVGEIDADGGVLIQDNYTQDTRIDAIGENIGGAFGLINTDDNLLVKTLYVQEASSNPGKTWVTSKSKNVGGAVGHSYSWNPTEVDDCKVLAEYVISEDDNVGGQFGLLETADALKYTTTTTDQILTSCFAKIRNVVKTIGSNVGGLIGQADYSDWANSTIRGTAYCPFIYAQKDPKKIKLNGKKYSGCNVGGIVGQATIWRANKPAQQEYVTFIDGVVVASSNNENWKPGPYKQEVEGILAENQNAGGICGFYESNNLRFAVDNELASSVTAPLIEATEGFAGGLFGDIETSYITCIGQSNEATCDDAKKSKNNSITVTVDKLAASYAVGGLVGGNTDNIEYISSKATKGTTIKIDVKDYENTVARRAKALGQDAENGAFTRSYFTNADDYKTCGSFGTAIGLMNSSVKIIDNSITVGKYAGVTSELSKAKDGKDGYTQEWVVEVGSKVVIMDAKKRDLLFRLGRVSAATQPEEEITGQGLYFWGDENGYLGVNANSANSTLGTGSYNLNGHKMNGSSNYNIYRNY